MKSEVKNGKLTVWLEGRIDTGNAPEIEKELMGIKESAPDAEVCLDIDKLEYISSAGLRVLMKLRKSTDKPVQVINASSAVYEIFETTGFVDLLEVHKKLRELSVEGSEKLGEGGNGAVYRVDDDTIVKVYKPWMEYDEISREREFARTAFVNGIPSVIAYDVVKVDDCYGVVFELLRSDTLGHAMRDNPDKIESYVDQYVELAKTLHDTHVPANSFFRIQDVYHDRINNLGQWCSEEEMTLLHDIVDCIPETDTVTHNDLHPGNIMIQDGELVLIDMPEVTMGPPICDLTSIYRDMIVAPNSEHGNIESSVGMPAEMISKVGNMFFMKYLGITDPAALEEYYKKIGLLFAFNSSIVAGSKADTAMKIADILMNKLLRPIVVPNEQAIKQLFKVL
ncbi:MAG: phosphotransferase [Eubacterium sp.]|nr:phosphotransferase [Eubacterium sp.]